MCICSFLLFSDPQSRRTTQAEVASLSGNNALVFSIVRSRVNKDLSNENDCRRHQKRQADELAQHTVKQTGCLTADMSRMWQMMYALFAGMCHRMVGRMHMNGR